MTLPALSIAALLAASPAIPYEAEIDGALAATATIYPVPKALVVAVISAESGFRPRAVSPAGARGLMQLMPYTARRVGIEERHLLDPAQNVLAGVRLLAVLLRHYEGDLIAALVAYNARPRRLWSPVPRNGETPAYVWKVLARVRRFSVVATTRPYNSHSLKRPKHLFEHIYRPPARGPHSDPRLERYEEVERGLILLFCRQGVRATWA